MIRIRSKYWTLATRSLWVLVSLQALAPFASSVAQAGQPEEDCQNGRYAAAAKYNACQQKALGRYYADSNFGKYLAVSGRCHTKYAAIWPKLQAKANGTGATCDNVRYQDTGDGTVTDRLTGLQWEKKTADGTLHDRNNLYSWSATGPDFTIADGSVFTAFLVALNSGGCLAGQCDWRLPTIYELQTTLLEAYPCATFPCIDQIVFGPLNLTQWSATSNATQPGSAWYVSYTQGAVAFFYKDNSFAVRAVRGGV